ncbi:MAG: hypothetical protein KF901_18855 [Myxococcales bacterium]|nr:hypothetical protein [Myxococcales bacterium]
MLTAGFSLFALSWLFMAVGIAVMDVRARRRAGPLEVTPVPVEALKDGTVAKIVGTVHLAEDVEPLEAPVSGRRCAGWVLRLARRGFFRWRMEQERRGARGFFVDDGTGLVFVSLDEQAHLDLCTAARAHAEPGRKLAARLRPFVKELIADGAVRCDEGLLTEGTRVAVYGVARRRPDGEPNHYRGRGFAFFLEGGAEGLRVSDDRAVLG